MALADDATDGLGANGTAAVVAVAVAVVVVAVVVAAVAVLVSFAAADGEALLQCDELLVLLEDLLQGLLFGPLGAGVLVSLDDDLDDVRPRLRRSDDAGFSPLCFNCHHFGCS